jgi:hypothetical protein
MVRSTRARERALEEWTGRASSDKMRGGGTMAELNHRSRGDLTEIEQQEAPEWLASSAGG